MPLVYIFAASKMEAQPVLVLAGQNGATGQGSTSLVIERGDERFAVIITGMGTRNAEAKLDTALGLAGSGGDGGPPLGGKAGCRAGDRAVRRTDPEPAGTADRRLHRVSFHRL